MRPTQFLKRLLTIAIALIFPLIAMGASNIYFLYGEQDGINLLLDDPSYNRYVEGELQDVINKGYHIHRIHNVAPETFLRVLSDPETVAVFYLGHATATQEEADRRKADLTVMQGMDYVRFYAETVDLANARLKLHGFPYTKPSPSLRFLHLGACYGESCRPFFTKKLNISPSQVQVIAWKDKVHPDSVTDDYINGYAAKFLAQLPANPSGPLMNGYEKNNQWYYDTLIDDLITLKIGDRTNFTLDEVVDIYNAAFPTVEQFQKLAKLAEPLIEGTKGLDLLTKGRNPRDGVAAAKAAFINKIFASKLDPTRWGVSDIKILCINAELNVGQVINVYEASGIRAVGSLEDFITLVTIEQPKSATRAFKQAIAAFAHKHEQEMLNKFQGTRDDLVRIRKAVSQGCHGAMMRAWTNLSLLLSK